MKKRKSLTITLLIPCILGLAVQFETVKGSIYMEIKEPGGALLYAGNGKGTTDFTVSISEGGVYFVHVEAHNAKGMIHIQQVDGKKAQF